MNPQNLCSDPVVLNEWHVLGSIDELPPGRVKTTRLLGMALAILRSRGGAIEVWLDDGAGAPGAGRPAHVQPLPTQQKFGYLWTTLGQPARGLFEIPEYAESDRRNLHAATFGIHVSAPRAVENFLDLGHFPFVHTDYLGVEPHTEVKAYDVEVSVERDEVLATRCRFYQPRAAASASEGFEVEYIYRVPHPYCAVLYKANPLDPARQDIITLFLQPVDQEHVNANMLLSLIDDVSSDTMIRMFQQTIFGQDKPILENQLPKRLPLDPRAEMPARADASSTAYRRWLQRRGVRYGTIPAAE
jgi:phenylpropionate dioxygenase-like ring-hydroxylating dioxygenase large terminal subunit